jgi:hypothetical protein
MDILDEPITYPEEVAAFDLSTQRDKFRIGRFNDAVCAPGKRSALARFIRGRLWPN